MQLSWKRLRCGQPHSSAGPGLSRPVRCLRCSAKRKGEQKNEGMYFTYEQVSPKPDTNAGNKSSEEQKQEFGWVSSARSSVQQYRQTPHKRTNRQQQSNAQSRQQQQSQQQASTAELTPALQSTPVTSPAGGAGAEPAEEPPQPEEVAADVLAAPAAAMQVPGQQQQPGTAATSSGIGDTAAEVVTPQPAESSNSSSSNSRTKEGVLAKRKQQLLQRLKGSAETPAIAAASAAVVAEAAATAPLAASLPAAETAAAEDGVLPGLDADGELLLQELLDMAQELTNADSAAAAATAEDNDPLADPLADILPEDYAGYTSSGSSSSIGGSSSNGNGKISITELGVAAADGDQEAADIVAVITAMQQRMPLSAAADDLDSSNMLRVADLLSWEAEEAVKNHDVTDLDLDAELAATKKGDYGEVPDEAQEGEWEYVEDEEGESEGELDDSWYENDPELKQFLAADWADFARLLAELNDMPDSSAPPGSGSGAAAAAEQQDAWAGLGAEDWLEAVAADSDGSEVDDDTVVDDDAVLSDVISAIEADQSLDDRGKVEARLRIQGMFNDPTTAAEGHRRSSRSGSKRQQQQQERGDAPVGKVTSTTTGAAAAAGGDDEQLPMLLPRPVRPSQ